MKNEKFLPFEQYLDEDNTKKILADLLKSSDDGELFIEEKRSESLVLDDQRLKSANLDASKGFGLRAVKNESTAFAHSTEISEKSLNRASETIKLFPHKKNRVLTSEFDKISFSYDVSLPLLKLTVLFSFINSDIFSFLSLDT